MRNKMTFTILVLLIGFLVAVQYNTIQKPKERDTRDIWAIRNELGNEKMLHSKLLSELREITDTMYTYESLENDGTGEVLSDTVEKLYEQAGMSDIEGPGIIIEVKPSEESVALGTPITDISPDLLTRFVNELSRNRWKALEIDGQRYRISSSIRDINGVTAVNGVDIVRPPFIIKVITETFEESEKLHSAILASSIHGDFYVDNLLLDVSNPEQKVNVRGWKDELTNLQLNELPEGD